VIIGNVVLGPGAATTHATTSSRPVVFRWPTTAHSATDG